MPIRESAAGVKLSETWYYCTIGGAGGPRSGPSRSSRKDRRQSPLTHDVTAHHNRSTARLHTTTTVFFTIAFTPEPRACQWASSMTSSRDVLGGGCRSRLQPLDIVH